MSEILLNKMFTGNYLSSNIGHEIINLFKDDQGRKYIYVLPEGRMGKTHNNKVDTILLVRLYATDTLEVLAKATVLTHIAIRLDKKDYKNQPGKTDLEKEVNAIFQNNVDYVTKNNICYGGKHIVDIFKGNNDKSNNPIYVTFEAESVVPPNQPLFIKKTNSDHPQVGKDSNDHFTWYVSEVQFHQTKFYDHGALQGALQGDAKVISDLVNDSSIWDTCDYMIPVNPKNSLPNMAQTTFLNLIRKEYDELSYSNMLAYYLEHDQNILQDFIKTVLQIECPFNSPFSIEREYKHIDLLIQNDDISIIIENKIHSDINGKGKDQLSRYLKEILIEKLGLKKGLKPNAISDDIFKDGIIDITTLHEELSKKDIFIDRKILPGIVKNIHCFLLLPNYSKVKIPNNMIGIYTIIRYSDVYDFFNKRHITDKYFGDFLEALKSQSSGTDDSLRNIMYQRFMDAIKRTNNNTPTTTNP